jgi:hypothetical protein
MGRAPTRRRLCEECVHLLISVLSLLSLPEVCTLTQTGARQTVAVHSSVWQMGKRNLNFWKRFCNTILSLLSPQTQQRELLRIYIHRRGKQEVCNVLPKLLGNAVNIRCDGTLGWGRHWPNASSSRGSSLTEDSKSESDILPSWSTS